MKIHNMMNMTHMTWNPQSASSDFTFTTAHVLGTELSTTWVTEAVDLGGFMVLDAACQRSCCGEPWLKIHSKILQRHGLRVKLHDCTDQFQFGSGRPVELQQRAYFPAAFAGQETQGMGFAASVLRTGIPFLASRTSLERLGYMRTKTLTFTFGFVHAFDSTTWTPCSQYCAFHGWGCHTWMLETVVKVRNLERS